MVNLVLEFTTIEILKPFFILATVRILTLDKLNSPKTKYFLVFLLTPNYYLVN